ncbi:MAG: hypothetical protein JO345_15265 [Streptosporangiaceae bacterium]|nr:hypothetical protein [Streptosporangiaceae bacterium]
MSPWRGTRPELVIAALLTVVVAAAGYVMASWAGLSAVVTVAAAITLAVPRVVAPRLAPDPVRTARKKPVTRTLNGYGQLPFLVQTATSSLASYNDELRPVLEHLLAARLAQRHGVHLYQNPAAARALLCRDPRDADLWPWIDPATRPEKSPRGHAEQPGIPRHTLARLIDRLEIL